VKLTIKEENRSKNVQIGNTDAMIRKKRERRPSPTGRSGKSLHVLLQELFL
jgi:hypothetical protein